MSSGNLVSFGELTPVIVSEARRHALAFVCLFVVISLAGLVFGLFWPKSYSSATTILAQKSDIIQPLLEGRAVATGTADRTTIAKQVIFSGSIQDEILKTGGWDVSKLDPIQQDRLREDIKNRTQITSPRENLIHIAYRDSDPNRSFKVTERFAELFIKESLAAKESESRAAFEFINTQVEAYHRKLTDAEENLKKYRADNVDAHPGSEADTNSRIGTLRSGVEQSRMNVMELRSTEAALMSQLTGESEVTAVQTRAGVYRTQMADLQAQLEKLLLTYTDQYPDVIRIRHQIEDLRKQVDDEDRRKQDAKNAGVSTSIDQNSQFNPLYAELRSKLADVRRQIAANESRMSATEALLNSEFDRSRRIAASESALAELTRDYEVNRDIYQDLLKRRENARVSMNLDAEGRGLTFRIQDPAVKPLRPSGLSTIHFAAAGLGLAFAMPLGILFLIARFDSRIRNVRELERVAGVPVLASVPVYPTRRERRREAARLTVAVLLLLGLFAAFALTYWYRLTR
ncbi:MAG: XrtA system polysaccharide chain length determinant [Dokdonella sp.]